MCQVRSECLAIDLKKREKKENCKNRGQRLIKKKYQKISSKEETKCEKEVKFVIILTKYINTSCPG